MNLHSNFIQNSPKLETAQCLSTEWTDAVTLHLGILLSNTKKKLLIHITFTGSRKFYAKFLETLHKKVKFV